MEKIGPIKQLIPNFVKYKQSLGYKYNNINHYYVLDKILLANNIFDLNDSKRIFEVLVENETNENRKKKNYSCLKQLYEYLKIIGYKDLYLKEYGFNTTSNFKPTILTNKQLNMFFETLDDYCNNSKNKEDYVFSVLFRLIYSCGLRITEPLNLKITDYSKENGTIYIKESKDNVTRELPLSNSMNKILKSYISSKNNNSTYLFEINNKKISYSQVSTIFKKVLDILDFKFRIHDLRHLFSITTFNNLYKQGYNEYWILYFLHIYLGHKSWKSTEHYLQFTSSHLKKAVKQFNNFYRNVGDKSE